MTTTPGALSEREDRYTPFKSRAECESAAIEAVRLLEDAEEKHSNCAECEGEGVPELCGDCFPHFDAARVQRRLVMQSLAALRPPAPESEDAKALFERAELAWQRFFYPANDCFENTEAADKLLSVDLEVADCLRLVLAHCGVKVRTPAGRISAPESGEVTQGDRDAAAADYWASSGGFMDVIGCALKAGVNDENELVQKHRKARLASLDALRPAGEGGAHIKVEEAERSDWPQKSAEEISDIIQQAFIEGAQMYRAPLSDSLKAAAYDYMMSVGPMVLTTPTPPPEEVAGLVERLRATEPTSEFATGGTILSSDGTCTQWGGQRIMRLRNPDGPQAADAIASLSAQVAKQREALATAKLVALTFKSGPRALARITRICIDAGIAEKLCEGLEQAADITKAVESPSSAIAGGPQQSAS